MDWRERLRLDSESCLGELVADSSDFSLDAEQPDYRGGTHYVTFGRYRGRPAVYKYFVAARRWRNESACLGLLQNSGLVPEVFFERDGTLIVMESLAGADVLSPQALGGLSAENRLALSREVGAAFGRLATMGMAGRAGDYDPRTDFPDWGWSDGFPSVADRCLRLGRKIADWVDPKSADTLRTSLALIAEQLPVVAREPWGLFHEDSSNLRVDSSRFVGFYDLELCRGGTPSMQLGAALNLAGPGKLDWGGLAQGFEETFGPQRPSDGFRSALAMNHLSIWIRLCEGLGANDDVVDAATLSEAEAATERMRATGRVILG